MTLEPGTLLLAREGMYAEWHTCTECRINYVFFEISPRPEASSWPVLRQISPGPLPGLLEYLLWLSEEDFSDWVSHAERVVDIILQMFVNLPHPQPEIGEHRALGAALTYIKEEWARRMRPIDMTELASVAHVSKEHLARLFSDKYGTGFVRALELFRVARAETLLTQTNLSVAEVALHCGYTDPLHFSKRFRAIFGSSPVIYRRGSARPTPLATAGLLPLARRLNAP
ncbi:helix-turn-helix domain-containing protein [Aminobacter aganoensis]|uniref:AraC-like DNA-binding protein n=1 Tax=Aminobacter aganoensis TaxID=83264 RepID=A0A7X0F600_9HYPH|nr:AraC family transcriptional regulator [Aminobacter aganoensis]MBB6353767.1 AraC-like DNA-binding protein [Aminobacter aganoensis]